MLKEFREFLLRGSVLDLAVAFVMGAAFTQVVTAFTDGILMALIAATVGQPSFDDLAITLNGTPIRYGVFLTALVNLLLVGGALFLFVKGINSIRRLPKEASESDHEVLVQIRDALRTPDAST